MIIFPQEFFFIAGFIHQVYWGPPGPESLDQACEAVEAQQPQHGPGRGSAGKSTKLRHTSGEEASGPLSQAPLSRPCPTTPGFGTRLQESTLKAMPGIIKMTNWRIVHLWGVHYAEEPLSVRLASPLQYSHQGTLIHSAWASQVALMVKNPPANAGDIRDTGYLIL